MLASIIPVFLIILLGVAIRRFGWMPADFFPSIEKFSYNIAFPAMLFAGTARLSFEGGEVAQLALATLLPTFAVVLLTLAALLLLPALPGASRSSVMQGAMRPNTYFGLAVAALFFPPETSSLVMLALALCLPVVNALSVVALAWWSGSKPNFGTVARTLAKNPIIQATLAGVIVSVAGISLPKELMNTLDILGKAATALGLLCVGGGLVFSLEGTRPAALTVTSVLKLLVMPLLAAQVCLLLDVGPEAALAACFYCALPTAPNAYIMAKQLGGDARLMASLITLQTLLAVITVPLSRQFMPWLGA
ncbi:AEC family transporter [Massilia dura]|uniref:AEC family transporter n=1 Tax=Pseudoduganella dura TaxID=321982 RepID=A0A6I3X8E7_9BURK|nr:AEC family transporter [Pseudoduganella dura]MUI12567.1 AEC family transporter [Pseudoduganella dura]GGY04004.1 transporter [Pseudoduganella dura]